MMMVLLFVIGFVAGPLVFWVLAKQRPTRRYVLLLWGLSVALVLAAVTLRQLLLPGGPWAGLAIILILWLAWIAVLALVMLAVRSRNVPSTTKRIAQGVTAAATTVPWFGLFTAQMVAE
ncbi:MAG: hypothetical protein AAFW87_07960 [Pseudomonadota bacterium]